MKKLQDFPEFQAAVEKLRVSEEALRSGEERKAAIQAEANKASPAARVAFHESWREEYVRIEQQEPLLLEQIDSARRELDRVRGQLSLEICREVRPTFLKQMQIVLRALKEISEANDAMTWTRHELDSAGIQTGSIAHSIFIMDRWSDQNGGLVQGYRQFIRQNFPEIKNDTY